MLKPVKGLNKRKKGFTLPPAITAIIISTFFFANGTVTAQNCTLNANVDQVICANEALILTGSKGGLFQGAGTTTWSQVSGPSAIITSPNSLVTTVTGIQGGNTYKFRLSTECLDGSLVYDDVSAIVKPITFANAGPDQGPMCPGAGTLAGNSFAAGETGSWSIPGSNDAGIGITTPSSPVSGYTASTDAAGTSTLRWTITGSNGCSSDDEMQLTNRGAVLAVNAGPDQVLSNCFSLTTAATLAGSFGGNNISGQTGIWTVISGPNIPTITNPTRNNSAVSNLVQGIYIFRWTVTGPCSTGYDEVMITVPAPVGSVTTAEITSGNGIYCDGRTSIVFSGMYPLYNNEVVSWTQTAGPAAAIASPGSPTTNLSGLNGSSTYTLSYTITNTVTGCSSTTSASIGYATPPSMTLTTSSPVIAACNANSVTVNYTQGGSGSVAYSIVSAPAGFPGVPTSYMNLGASPATISGLTINGTYVIQLRKSALGIGCSDVFQSITVITSVTPSNSNGGTKQLLACNVVSTDLVGNVPVIGTGSWSQVMGPNVAVIADPLNPATHISGLVSGLYRFRWKISGGPACPTRQNDAQVAVSTIAPTSANAGPDQTVCFNTPVYLAGNTPILNETSTWTVSPGAGVVFSPDANTPKAVVTGLAANTVYTFTWNIANACAPPVSDQVIITTTSTQGPIASAAGNDQCLPGGTTTLTLEGNDPGPGTGTWTKLSGPAAVITNPGQYNSTVTGLTNGTYKFMWAITYGACAFSSDTVMVTISVPVTTAVVGMDQNICGSTATLTGNNPVIGTGLWSQEAGAGGVSITSPSASTTGITGLTTGSFVFYWTISNNACPGSSDSVQLNVSTVTPVVPMAGPDKSVCGLSSVTMAANNISPGMGLWSLVSGPNAPNITNVKSPTTTVTGLESGIYIFRWTSYGGEFCTPLSDDVTIDVTPASDAGPNQSSCFANSANLTGNDGSAGTWSQVGVTPNIATIVATSSFSAVASGLIAGTYTFRYTISANGSCGTPSADDMTVSIFSSTAPANAGPDQQFCNVASFILTGNNPAPYSGTWTKVAGPAGGSFNPNANSPNATFTGAVPGVYIFSWTIANSSCSSVDEVRITNYATPSIAAAGPDQGQVCGTVATMAANLPVNGLGNWTLVSKPAGAPNPVITSPILPSTTITNLVPVSYPGTYVFRWTISNGICASSSDVVAVTVYQQPTQANAGPDREFCNVSSVTLGGNQPAIGTGQWTKISGPAATITSPSAYNSTVTGMTPGTYVFDWTTTNLPCSTSDQVTIIIYALPTTASTSGTDIDICLFSPMNLAGNTPVNGTGLWTQTGGTPVFIINPASPTTAVAGAAAGNYSFRYTVSNGTCAASSSNVTINVAQVPTMALAGPDQSVCNTLTATFEGNTPDPGQGTGTWSQLSGPAAAINSPNSPVSTVTLTGAGTYKFIWEIATNASCTSSDQMQIVKNNDVTVTSPSGAIICNGGTTTLSVTAAGGIPPYTYQWQQSANGSSGWVNAAGGSGAASNSYTTAALASDLYYRCMATSSCGSGLSATAHITVVPDPVITIQPVANTTLCSGSSTALSVSATDGTPSLTYQWQSNTSGCAGAWANIPGATGNNYTTAALTQTTYYRVLVAASGSGCNTATSNCATVHVPRIITQPVNSAICTGGVGTMTIAADFGSSTLAYQWQSSPDNTTWLNVSGGSGANTASYTTGVLLTTRYYRCIVTVTSPNCASLISNSATLTVVPDPAITVQPVSPANICSGGTTANMTLTATGGTPFLIYNWQYFNGATWNNVANGTPAGSSYTGYTNATFSVSGISAAGNYQYRCEISASGNDCNTINSNPVTVTVIPDPTLSLPVFTIPTLCSGGSTTVSSTISGGMGIPTYQWQYNNGSWNNVANGTPAGATYTNASTPTMTISGTTAAGLHQYRLTTSNSSGCDFNSTGVSYTLVADPYITVQPASQAICTGGIHSMSVTAAGGTPSLDYQWRSSPDNITFTDIPGATTSSYTTPVLATTTYYRVYVSATGEGCGNVTSATAMVTVVPDPTINTQPSNAIICTGGTNTLTVSASGGTPALIYQWQSSTTGGAPWTNAGTNSSSYTTPALLTKTYYQVVISATGNDCNTVTSGIATITVVPDPNISAQPVGATICAGGNHTFSLTASGDPLTGALLYQWQSGPNTGSYTNIPGATASSYASGALAGTTYFRCIVTQAPSGCSVTSADALVTVVPDPGITAQPVGAVICSGGNHVLSVTATGGTPLLDYQWRSSTDNVIFTDIPGAITPGFTTPALTTTTYYRVYISATGTGCGNVTSSTATVTVVPDPTINTQPAGTSICTGGTHTLTVSASGGTPALIYQWQSSATGAAPWTNVGTNSNSYTTVPLVTTTYYHVVISATGNDCNTTTSNTASVTVNTSPAFSVCPSDITQNTDANQCSAAVNYAATTTGMPAPVITYAFSGATAGSGNGTGSGFSFNKGITNVVITATNSCGTAACSFTVAITDAETPVITTCPPIRNIDGCSAAAITGPVYSTASAVSNEAEFENGTNQGNASDNCGITSVTYIDVAAGSCPVTVTRTWTVKDAAGNSATCVQTIKVADHTAPVAICRNITIALNASGNASITAADINNGSTDNCGIASLSASKTSFTCSDTGPNTVTLSVTDNCGNISTCNAVVTVTDPVAPSLSINDVTVNESAGTATFIASITHARTCDITFTVNTANNTAVSGSDYTAITSTTYTIPAGSTSVTINVPILDDSIAEPAETYFVNLTDATSAAISDGSGLGTIIDDDAVTLALSGFTVTETDGTQTQNFVVTLNIPAQKDIVITFTTLNGTATSGSDFISQSAVNYTIPAGSTTINIPVSVLGDLVSEPTETFTGIIAISNANGQSLTIATGTAISTILDDDIIAVDDTGNPVNSYSGGTAVVNVLLNDEIYGSFPTLSEVILSQVNSLDPNGIPTTNVRLNADGSVTVAPGTPSGIYTVTYQICEILNPSNCDQAIVTLTVATVQIIASDDSGSVSGINGGTAVADILVNDSLNGNPVNPADITISFISATHPGVTMAGTSVIVAPGTPAGVYSLVYQICEVLNASNCDQATVTVTVTNDPPVVTGITTNTPEDNAISICLPITDPDAGSTFTAGICGNPANGSLSIPVVTGNQVCITYTPNPDYNGTDRFCIRVCDNGIPVLCDTALITINVTPVNDAPVVINEYETTCNSAVITGNILANGDSDPEGTALSIVTTPVAGPANGSFTILPNGDFTYSPAATFAGTDQIIVSICDKGIPLPSLCTNDTIFITVIPSVILTAGPDTTVCEKAGSITLDGVGAQHYNSIVWTTAGSGTFNDSTLLKPTYMPGAADLSAGSVVLTMHVAGSAPCGDKTATLKIAFASAPKVNAGNDVTICNNSPYPLNSASASDYASLTWVYSPANAGTLSDANLLNPIFIPNEGYTGNVTLTLKANSNAICGSSEVNDDVKLTIVTGISLNAGTDQIISRGAETTLHGEATGGSGLYAWSWDPSALLESNIVPDPLTLLINTRSRFTLTVLDIISGCSAQDEVVVSMALGADDDYDTTNVNTAAIIPEINNDSNPDGDPLRVSICGNPAHGAVAINQDNTITYTPDDKFIGDDKFCYMICENGNSALCDTATVFIHVKARMDDLVIFNLLTPNGDNSNDAWIIRGIEDYPDNTVIIFNRWGDKVRDFSGYDNKGVFWDGTSKNGLLPSGTYYYLLTIKNVGSRTGWIYLHGKEE